MTGIRMVSMGLRLVALWLVVLAFQAVGATFAVQKITAIDHPGSSWWAALPAAVLLSLAAIIWFFAPIIAKQLYREESAGETVEFSAETMLRVGSCLLGLWTFSTVLPATAQLIVIAYLRSSIGDTAPPYDSQSHIVYVLAQFVVSMVLVFGNRAIYRMTLGREVQI